MATINSHGLILREWEAVFAAIEANPELVPLVEEQRETLRLPPLRPLLPRDGPGPLTHPSRGIAGSVEKPMLDFGWTCLRPSGS